MVYVIQEVEGRNISGAIKFGEIKVLLSSSANLGFSAGAIVKRLYADLSSFCDHDYILLMGDPALIGTVVAVASHWNQGRVKMLKWDRQASVYYPVSIDIYSTEEKKNAGEQQF